MFLKVTLIVAFLAAIVACIFFILTVTLTSREAGLLSVVLAIFSIVGTWIVAHMYSESSHRNAIAEVQESHRTNLRTYGLNAFEKVNNLSSQLTRLAAYLHEELTEREFQKVPEALLSREERLSSAIHIIRTLKSVNDTSLGDWRGVIGEEIDDQREQLEERDRELQFIIERAEMVIADQQQDLIGNQVNNEELRAELEALKTELRAAIYEIKGGVSSVSPVRRNPKPVKQPVEATCPVCSVAVTYRQRPNPKGQKSVRCSGCEGRLVSRYATDFGFFLQVREEKDEEISCSECGTASVHPIDILFGISTIKSCPSCGIKLRITRTEEGLVVRSQGNPTLKSKKTEVDALLLDAIKDAYGPQPWISGKHKEVSKKLGITNRLLNRSVQTLIRRGDFYPQINGVVYGPIEIQQIEHEAPTPE